MCLVSLFISELGCEHKPPAVRVFRWKATSLVLSELAWFITANALVFSHHGHSLLAVAQLAWELCVPLSSRMNDGSILSCRPGGLLPSAQGTIPN